MLRKTVIALMATAAVAMLVPDVASAQRGFGGGRGERTLGRGVCGRLLAFLPPARHKVLGF